MKNEILAHDWFPDPIPSNVRLGHQKLADSSFAFIHYHSEAPIGVQVGHHSGLYDGTFFDLGPNGSVTIGSYCTLVGVILSTDGQVEIGDFAFLAHEVVIADSFAAMPHRSRVESSGGVRTETGLVSVGDGAWIGMRAILLPGARIGSNAVIGAAAVVRSEIPENAIAVGNPARVVGTVG